MRFVAKWDEKARRQLMDCKKRSGKPVLCSHSSGTAREGKEPVASVCLFNGQLEVER